MNKKIIIISIVILLALLAGAGIWKWKNKPQNITETQKQSEQNQNESDDLVTEKDPLVLEKIDTSNWQTYRNEEYGFEVKYPKDWEYDTYIDDKKNLEISLGEKGKIYQFEGPQKNAIHIGFSKKKDNNSITQKKLFETWKKYYNISIWKANINGIRAYYYKGFGEGLNMTRDNFDFSITSPISLESSGYPEVRSVLHGMIQSLHFID